MALSSLDCDTELFIDYNENLKESIEVLKSSQPNASTEETLTSPDSVILPNHFSNDKSV